MSSIRKLHFLLLICSLTFVKEMAATHLMGGNMTYTYIGVNPNTGNYQYEITLSIYRYCAPEISTPLDPSVIIGAWEETPSSLNKLLRAVIVIPLTSSRFIVPPGSAGCTTAPNVCVEEGIYKQVIELPWSAYGYHLMHERCCRNNNITNLNNPGSQGQTYYAFIPPSDIVNSSPVFLEAPVPYFCSGDSVTILNTAIDPEGDRLEYTLVNPYRGTANQGNPGPFPANIYRFPIATVIYKNDSVNQFNQFQPFGLGGSAEVDASTGLSTYYVPNTGFYVVAVEVNEFRNNQLIGTIRRDMQLIVVPCASNPAPNLSSSTLTTNYTITEGDTLCFTSAYTDPNGNGINLDVSGDIFDSTVTNPPATMSNSQGQGAVSSQFCWNTTCSQAGDYLFVVRATDDGCPAKVTNTIYTIHVLPHDGPDSINGSVSVCSNQVGTSYNVVSTVGSTYQWTISGGTQISGGNSNTITVTWEEAGSGSVCVTETNSKGCISAPLCKTVIINPLPVVNAGRDTTICKGSSTILNASGGTSYSWTPSAGLTSTTGANPVATPTSTTNYVVVGTDAQGCQNTDTVTITINPIQTADAGTDKSICIGNSATIGGAPTGPVGSIYSWSPATGLNASNIANPIASPTLTTNYTVTVSGTNTCSNEDVVLITVTPLPIAKAGSDVALCSGGSTTLNASGGTSYTWVPSTGLSSSSISNPVATPNVTTNYIVTVTDANSCKSTDTVTIIVHPLPIVNAGSDKTLCIGANATIGGSPTGPSKSTYTWSPSTGLSSTNISNPVATSTVTTNYTVSVTDTNTCKNTDIVSVTVNSSPIVNAGSDKTVCLGNNTNIGGSPTGPTGSTYLWAPSSTLNSATTSNPTASPTLTTTYTVTVTDANTCKNTDTVLITVNPLPIARAGSDVAICSGSSTTLNASGGTSYTWTPTTGLSSSSISKPVATPSVTTNYIVTVTDANSCESTDTVTITVHSLPIVNAGSDKTLCIGGNTTIGGSPTGPNKSTYTWSPSTGLSFTNISNPVATPTVTTNYTVSVTDTNTCKNTDIVSVTVNSLPIVNAGSDKTICLGNNTTIGGSPTGPTGSTYLWTPSTALNTSISSNPTSAPTVTTSYTVTVTDPNNCQNTDIMQVIVNPLPAANAGNDISICIGKTTMLNASGGINYSWLPSTGLSSTNISNPIATPTTTTNYTVTVTDINTCQKTDAVTITVNPLPNPDLGPDIWLCPGDNIQLNAHNGTTYNWTPATGLNNTAIATPIANPSNTTTYTVSITDANTCTNTDTVIVTVNAKVPTDAGPDKTICIGDSTQIGGAPTGPPTGNSIYTWSPSIGLSSTIVANPMASPTVTTTYTVTVLNDTCHGTDIVVITVNPLPNANAGTDQAICTGSSTTLTASGGISYTWTPSNGLSNTSIANPIASPTITTDYIVTVTDVNTCQKNDTITIKVNPLPMAITGNDTIICLHQSLLIGSNSILGHTYKWTSNPSGFTSTNSKQIITPKITATYILAETITATTCSKTDSITIVVHSLPSAITGKDTSTCYGKPVTIGSDSVPGNTYSWTSVPLNFTSDNSQVTVTPSDTITYILTETITNTGCTKTDSVTINVWQLPKADAGPDIAICNGDTAHINASGIGSYQWTPSTGLNNDTIPNPIATSTVTTTYTLTITNINGCIGKDTIQVQRNPLPIASAGEDQDICVGDSIMLEGNGGAVYFWAPSEQINNSNISNPYVRPLSTITYTVTVTDTNNCNDIASVTIRVNSIPTGGFSAIYTPSCEGMLGEFTNKSIGADTYLWDFSDGITSQEENPVHVFPYSQSYTIKQIAINNGICNDTSIATTTVSSLNDNIIATYPNVFTPNGDGINDLFQLDIKGKFRDCSSLIIYNRWGVKVSDTNVLWWDGRTTAGEEVPDGLYFYVFKIKDSFVIKGSVTLLR